MLAIISIWKPKPGLLEPPALGTVSDKRVCYLCPGLTTPIPSVARYGWNQSNSVFVTRFHISAPELYRGAEPLEALHALIVSTYNITKTQTNKQKSLISPHLQLPKPSYLCFMYEDFTVQDKTISCCLFTPISMILKMVSFLQKFSDF